MTTLSLISNASSAAAQASVVSCARAARQALWAFLDTVAEYRAARREMDAWDGGGHLPTPRRQRPGRQVG